jgi:hypothetical protein
MEDRNQMHRIGLCRKILKVTTTYELTNKIEPKVKEWIVMSKTLC